MKKPGMTARTRRTLTKAKLRIDGMLDIATGRGTQNDITQRLKGQYIRQTSKYWLDTYKANGFAQLIVDRIARDHVRKKIELTTNLDEQFDLGRKIENRLDELKIWDKLYNLNRFRMIYPRGGFMYWGLDAERQQGPVEIAQPMGQELINKIRFLNVVYDSDFVNIIITNYSQFLDPDYAVPVFFAYGKEIHPSRLSWMCEDFDPTEREGISFLHKLYDAITALDSSLWSSHSLLSSMALKVLTSDELVSGATPEERSSVMAMLRYYLDTQGVLAINSNEKFERQINSVTGIKELFDFIMDIYCGLAQVPRKVVFGNAQGIVQGAEVDVMSYYSRIESEQELYDRPILEKLIGTILVEKNTPVAQALQSAGLKADGVDWEFDFADLWTLAPLEEAQTRLTHSQADQIDVSIGKVSPLESRELDDRYSELEDLTQPWAMGQPRPASGGSLFWRPRLSVVRGGLGPQNLAGESQQYAPPAASPGGLVRFNYPAGTEPGI